ncbi:uncharacterized protein K444DRAFT_636707 [Hyaloscypha bicolor E]|uniref:Uncharacterized protein n=1 Tax=Hyaloscypha bicolor E TaxID=1095630 RepID=A0A2J6SKX8_9HELO|nr:uncharacterized protein K444DRAFT_636707 [Hyaloscypha bicolor E]PMD51404.1 hypothetical protein K444DRAFT_636707 [Hyaloscypha bicolor E]
MQHLAQVIAIGGICTSTCLSLVTPFERAANVPPAEFTANPTPSRGAKYLDSPRFRIHNYTTTSVANTALTNLEFGYTCFVEDLGRRSAGLTVNGRELSDSPYCKMNVYNVGSLGANTAANTGTESTTGLTFLNVVTQYLTTPSHRSRIRSCVGIHGKVAGEPNSHRCLAGNNCAVRGEPHSVCAHARGKYNQSESDSLVDINKVISDSFQVIVDGTSGSGIITKHLRSPPI